MIISKDQLARVRERIKQHYNSLIFKMVGPEQLTDEEIKRLLEEGLIPSEDLGGLLLDAYYIGHGRNVSDPRDRAAVTLSEFRSRYKDLIKPVTDTELYAIQHVLNSAGNHLVGIRDKARNVIENIINVNNLEERNRLLDETVRAVLVENIARDATISKIATDLRDATEDLFRDWKRVTVTEVAAAMNLGEADSIVDRNRGKSTSEIYVYKRVNLDSALCKYCREAYLMSDGITPRVFRLSELVSNDTNYGRSAAEYLPTITPLHVNCRCALVELPNGWSFDPTTGQTIYKGPNYQHLRDTK